MEIELVDNMQIEGMDKDALLNKYVELQKAMDSIKMSHELLKTKFAEIMEKEDIKKYDNDAGEVIFIPGKITQRFDNKIAKELLGDESTKCMVDSERKGYIKVVSTEAKENMKF